MTHLVMFVTSQVGGASVLNVGITGGRGVWVVLGGVLVVTEYLNLS